MISMEQGAWSRDEELRRNSKEQRAKEKSQTESRKLTYKAESKN